MLKLTEVYRDLLVESQTEDQARNILKKGAEERGFSKMDDEYIDKLVKQFKEIDPSDQNRYLPMIAHFYFQQAFNTYNMHLALEVMMKLENRYNVKLLYSKKNGVTFNKDLEDFGIQKGQTYYYVDFVTKMDEVDDILDKINELKRAKRSEDEKEKPEVDGKPVNRVWKGDEIEIYAGRGKQACIKHSKGTSWCIGNPSTGHYEDYRKGGSSFYIVYDYSVPKNSPAGRVVVEVIVEKLPDGVDEFEEPDYHISDIYDKENRQPPDNRVHMNTEENEWIEGVEDYLSYLVQNHDVDTDEVFQPIPLEGELEMKEYVENAEDIDDLIGEVYKLKDGTIVDLTLEYIKTNGLNHYTYERIAEHPVTKKYLKDYVESAIFNKNITTGALKEIPDSEKYIKKYFNKLLEHHNNQYATALSDLPNDYVDFLSQEFLDDIIEKHLESGKNNIVPNFIAHRVSTDLNNRTLKDLVKRRDTGLPTNVVKYASPDVRREALKEYTSYIDNDQMLDSLVYGAKEVIGDEEETIKAMFESFVDNPDLKLSSSPDFFVMVKNTIPETLKKYLEKVKEEGKYVKATIFKKAGYESIEPEYFIKMLKARVDKELKMNTLANASTEEKANHVNKLTLDLSSGFVDTNLISNEKVKEIRNKIMDYVKDNF